MPRIGPISRADLIRYLRKLGFEGPYTGPDHAFMLRGNHKQRIPNKHEGDISKGLLVRILRQAGISVEEWESYKLQVYFLGFFVLLITSSKHWRTGDLF